MRDRVPGGDAEKAADPPLRSEPVRGPGGSAGDGGGNGGAVAVGGGRAHGDLRPARWDVGRRSVGA